MICYYKLEIVFRDKFYQKTARYYKQTQQCGSIQDQLSEADDFSFLGICPKESISNFSDIFSVMFISALFIIGGI